jgi:hypothetical protein
MFLFINSVSNILESIKQLPKFNVYFAFLKNYFFLVFCLIGFLISIIPLHIVKYRGTIKSFDWKICLCLCFLLPALFIIFGNFSSPARDLFQTISSSICFVSTVGMIICFLITWYELKKQRLTRFVVFNTGSVLL